VKGAGENLVWEVIKAIGLNEKSADVRISDDDLNSALTQISQDALKLREALSLLFPNGIPLSQSFYAQLNQLEVRLGLEDKGSRFVGTLWYRAVETLEPNQREELLNAFTLDSDSIFHGLDWLPILLANFPLPASFSAEWLPKLVKRIGNDLAAGELWVAFDAYCERNSLQALDSLKILINHSDMSELGVATHFLGVLRGLDLPLPLQNEIRLIDEELKCTANPLKANVYNRSWIETVRRKPLTKEQLEQLISKISHGLAQEREEAIPLVIGILSTDKLDSVCREFIFNWLKNNVNPDIPRAAKFRLAAYISRDPQTLPGEVIDLVLDSLPIPIEDKGTWKRIEMLLVRLLRSDIYEFSVFFLSMAEKAPEEIISFVKAYDGFPSLLREMRSKEISKVVGDLCISSNPGCRRLGLLLFDKVKVETIPREVLSAKDARHLATIFHEGTCSPVHGDSIARFLVSLISCMEEADPELQAEFYEELVLQLKNYPGGCRAVFEASSSKFPILRKAIDEVDQYFERLEGLSRSGTMEVTGFRAAARVYARRFSRQVSESAEKMSVFASLFQKVHLLYGNEVRAFHEGELGGSSPMREISHGVEVPRLEFIDPEGMQLRRLHAASVLKERA
jgi:hypothetical protein